MLLSDSEIQEAIDSGELAIEPLLGERIQPSSIDLTLGDILHVHSSRPIPGISIDPELLQVRPFISANTTEEDLSGGRIWKLEPGALSSSGRRLSWWVFRCTLRAELRGGAGWRGLASACTLLRRRLTPASTTG